MGQWQRSRGGGTLTRYLHHRLRLEDDEDRRAPFVSSEEREGNGVGSRGGWVEQLGQPKRREGEEGAGAHVRAGLASGPRGSRGGGGVGCGRGPREDEGENEPGSHFPFRKILSISQN